MKLHQIFLLFVLFLLSSSNIISSGSCKCDPADVNSKTFFSVRPHFQTFSPEKNSFFRDTFIRYTEDDRTNKLELTVYGSAMSDKDKERLARYFLPFGKSTILVASNQAANVADRDVNAIHLNIDHDDQAFESCVTFIPEQKVIGLGVHYRQWFSRTAERGFWFDIAFPFERVQNTITLCEDITNSGDSLKPTRVENVTDAFEQDAWCYGKISSGCCMRETKIADIEIKIGYEPYHSDHCHAQIYLGAVVPTGNKPTACRVFEPIVGNNKHWGIITGSTLAVCGWFDGERSLCGIIDVQKRYLFKNSQRRSFDLVDKSWGRYMEVYQNQTAAQTAEDNASDEVLGDHGTPGINVFTRCADVTPGFSGTVNNALLFISNGFHAEIGYNLFARQKEKVEICQCLDSEPALVGQGQAGYVTRARTIKENFVGTTTTSTADEQAADFEHAQLSIGDFDVSSAAHPAQVAHTFYASLGYGWKDCDYPPFVGVGASYEFGSNNTVLRRWTVWGKLALAF